MNTAHVLNDIAQKLSDSRTSSREVASIEFEAEGRDISIRIRSELLPLWYPPLGLILGSIGNTCVDGGVTLSQLRRVTFGEKEVRVELRTPAGPAGAIFAFPIQATEGTSLLCADGAPLEV